MNETTQIDCSVGKDGKRSVMQRLLLLLIRMYQLTLSPLMGGQCRFYPTCSHYATEAVCRHGAGHGMWLAIRRLAKCHPFHPGGVDLVPGDDQQPSLHSHPSIHS